MYFVGMQYIYIHIHIYVIHLYIYIYIYTNKYIHWNIISQDDWSQASPSWLYLPTHAVEHSALWPSQKCPIWIVLWPSGAHAIWWWRFLSQKDLHMWKIQQTYHPFFDGLYNPFILVLRMVCALGILTLSSVSLEKCHLGDSLFWTNPCDNWTMTLKHETHGWCHGSFHEKIIW